MKQFKFVSQEWLGSASATDKAITKTVDQLAKKGWEVLHTNYITDSEYTDGGYQVTLIRDRKLAVIE